eukprot:1075105-Rhodomonas_salina.1
MGDVAVTKFAGFWGQNEEESQDRSMLPPAFASAVSASILTCCTVLPGAFLFRRGRVHHRSRQAGAAERERPRLRKAGEGNAAEAIDRACLAHRAVIFHVCNKHHVTCSCSILPAWALRHSLQSQREDPTRRGRDGETAQRGGELEGDDRWR